jgi:PAS domain S-box-containing protein
VVEDLPSWRRFTGQSLEEIQGWGWSKALHPDDLARTSEVWRKAVKAHTAYETEYRIRRHDGVFRDFLARGVPALNEDGSIREWVGTCIDITERKEAEEEIRSLARFPGENPNPILRLNRDGVILYANEVGGVVLETWRCGIGDRAPDPWADTIQGALERQLRTTVDLTCGDRIYMLFVTPIAEAGYVNLYATDITEQKRAEEALRQAHDRLEQAVRERTAELSRAVETLGWQAGQLRALATELTLAEQRERRRLAGLLHDGLQQLLVAARLRAQMLGRSDDPKIQQGSREIAELLAEALADARSLAGELSPPTLQRGDLLPALEWLARWMLEKHHFTVAIHPPVEALPALPEDLAVLLYQGVRELLLNAVKHAQVAAAEVTFIPAGNALTLAVADAGVGFDSRRLRAEGGTQSGFGLLGIRERLGLAGGRLEIASAPGRGSRFTLTVPLHPAPADPAPSHTPIDPDSVPSAGTGTGQDAE